MSVRSVLSSSRSPGPVAALAALAGLGTLVYSANAGDGGIASAIAVSLTLSIAAWVSLTRRIEAERVELVQVSRRIAERDLQLQLDPLTGHLNRYAFNRTLQDLAGANSKNTMIAIYFFDLNRFKEVNDTLGHDIGDLLLIEVGKRAAATFTGALALARLGGDEFAAIVPLTDERAARQLGEDLVHAISQPYALRERQVEVGASVGIAIGDPAVQGGDELLRRADLAMYEVKGTVGGAVHVFDDLLSNRQMRENTIRAELGKSAFENRFSLHYQPIVDARTGTIEKAEALLRPVGGNLTGISPALMVSVAEDSGQIVALTEWTLDTALQAAKQLKLPVAVNVSPIYFRNNDFADRLIERLISSGCAPSQLIVEVTEGVLISDITRAREAISHLRAIGIEVYLDDFGTGYSSLSYLQNFELDGMKLDRSFIQDLGKSEKAIRIVRSMVDFSHSLGMKTVIEGVESEWQARILQLQGCDFLQGFELGLPMPCRELVRVLHDRADAEAEARAKRPTGSEPIAFVR